MGSQMHRQADMGMKHAERDGGLKRNSGSADDAEPLVDADTRRNEPSVEPRNAFLALIGNTALFGAMLIYMGWDYEDSALRYFQVSLFSLNISPWEIALKGLVPLYESDVVFLGMLLVVALSLASKASAVRKLMSESARKAVGRIPKRRNLVLIIGFFVTVLVLPFIWVNLASGSFVGWWASHRYQVYFILALLVTGKLLIAWPVRRGSTSPFVYPLALIVAAMCTLWAAGFYSSSLGIQAARSFTKSFPAAAVYSVRQLGLSGPGVTCGRVAGATEYPYVCGGLRLLYDQSGTYGLLPVGWTLGDGRTFILDDSNQIRIELSPGSLLASFPSGPMRFVVPTDKLWTSRVRKHSLE